VVEPVPRSHRMRRHDRGRLPPRGGEPRREGGDGSVEDEAAVGANPVLVGVEAGQQARVRGEGGHGVSVGLGKDAALPGEPIEGGCLDGVVAGKPRASARSVSIVTSRTLSAAPVVGAVPATGGAGSPVHAVAPRPTERRTSSRAAENRSMTGVDHTVAAVWTHLSRTPGCQ